MAPNIEQTCVATITDLYRAAGLPRPTGRRPVTPLGQLIGCLDLVCREVPGLTGLAAMRALAPYGVTALATCDEEPLAGYLYATNRFGAIFVRQDDPVARRRFSVAHELGHYLLHFRPLLLEVDEEGAPLLDEVDDSIGESQAEGEPGQVAPIPPRDISDRLPPYAQREREADTFAAYLLMPEDVVRSRAAYHDSRCKDEDLVWRLASDLLVSQTAMRWRLRALGLFAGHSGEVA